MQSIVSVFTAFKALFTSVIKACSLDPADLEEDIAGHNGRALTYLQAVASSLECTTPGSAQKHLSVITEL